MGISPVTGINTDEIQYTRQTEAQAIQQAAQEQQVEKTSTVQAADNAGTSADSQLSRWTAETAQNDLSSVGSSNTESNTLLVSKANSGAELSNAELAELEESNPALAAQVKRAQAARQQLRQEMEANPSCASRARYEAESRHTAAADRDTVVRQALNNEYQQFTRKYDQMEFRGR